MHLVLDATFNFSDSSPYFLNLLLYLLPPPGLFFSNKLPPLSLSRLRHQSMLLLIYQCLLEVLFFVFFLAVDLLLGAAVGAVADLIFFFSNIQGVCLILANARSQTYF